MTYFIGVILAMILNFIIVRTVYKKQKFAPDWEDIGVRLFLVALSWVGAVFFTVYLIYAFVNSKKPPTWL